MTKVCYFADKVMHHCIVTYPITSGAIWKQAFGNSVTIRAGTFRSKLDSTRIVWPILTFNADKRLGLLIWLALIVVGEVLANLTPASSKRRASMGSSCACRREKPLPQLMAFEARQSIG